MTFPTDKDTYLSDVDTGFLSPRNLNPFSGVVGPLGGGGGGGGGETEEEEEQAEERRRREERLAELSKIEFSTISFPDDPTTSFGGPLDEFDSYEDYRDDLVAKGHLIAVPKVDRLLADAAGLAKDDPLRNEMNYIPNSTKGSRVLDQFALLGLEIGKNLIPGYKFTQGFRKGVETIQGIFSGEKDDGSTLPSIISIKAGSLPFPFKNFGIPLPH